MTVLAVEGISKRYGGLVAVDGISFELQPGEILGVIGPNGAGKSTLLGLLAGDPPASDGRVVLAGKDVTRRRPYARCRLGISRTFQIPKPFGRLDVRRNVEIAARFGGTADTVDVDAVIERCGLSGCAHSEGEELTHAQQRRLEFARSLATEPKVLLLDEVGAGLAAGELEELDRLIRRIAESGTAVVVVEHIMSLVMGVSDRVIAMNAGRLIADAVPKVVAESESVMTAYFGTAK